METVVNPSKRALLVVLKDLSTRHTTTSLAKELKLTRVGTWKILKKLEHDSLITFNHVGVGKTSTGLIALNGDNILVEKMLSLYLTEEALVHQRWRVTFAELEKMTDFLILYGSILHSPKEARDIDLVGMVSSNRFVKVDMVLHKIQKTAIKKVHTILFEKNELMTELEKHNTACIDAIKKGVVLFGQEKFISFMKQVHRTWQQ